MTGPRTDLEGMLLGLDWSAKYPSLNPSAVKSYILAKVGTDSIADIFVGSVGSYENLNWDLQVVVRTSGGIYEFLFDKSLKRYDFMLLKDIYRIEERVEDEESVQGPNRERTTVSIYFQSPTAVEAILRGYDEEGKAASSFGDRVQERLAKGF